MGCVIWLVVFFSILGFWDWLSKRLRTGKSRKWLNNGLTLLIVFLIAALVSMFVVFELGFDIGGDGSSDDYYHDRLGTGPFEW